jgi:transposase
VNSTARKSRLPVSPHGQNSPPIFPGVEVGHELPLAERQCTCGSVLAEIGADLSEQIDYVPAKVQVLRHVRAKYACRGCEQCVKTAPVPEHIPPKTNASPGLLAQLVTSKYVDSLGDTQFPRMRTA